MTSKELIYLDDALGHAQFLTAQFQDAASKLKDAGLRQQAQQMADRHRGIYQTFYGLM